MANSKLAYTLPIYEQTYELLLLIVKVRKQFSRAYRYDLGSRLFDSSLRCLELIQKANTAVPTEDYIPKYIGAAGCSVDGLIGFLCCFVLEWRTRRISRRQYLEDFIVEFGTVKMLIGVCRELGLISNADTARVALLTESIGKQATAWKKSVR